MVRPPSRNTETMSERDPCTAGIETHHHAGAQRQQRGGREHRHADANVVGERQIVLREHEQAGQRPIREHRAKRRCRGAQQQALDEKLPDDAAARGAERGPQADFLPAAGEPNEKEVRHVGARDHQQESDRGKQRQQRRARGADNVVAERDGGQRPRGVGIAGCAAANRVASTSSSRRACSSLTPVFRRPTGCR